MRHTYVELGVIERKSLAGLRKKSEDHAEIVVQNEHSTILTRRTVSSTNNHPPEHTVRQRSPFKQGKGISSKRGSYCRRSLPPSGTPLSSLGSFQVNFSVSDPAQSVTPRVTSPEMVSRTFVPPANGCHLFTCHCQPEAFQRGVSGHNLGGPRSPPVCENRRQRGP